MKKATIKWDFPYVPNKDYYVVMARSAWDTVPIGLYDTFNSAHADFPTMRKENIRKATQLEIDNFFGLVEDK